MKKYLPKYTIYINCIVIILLFATNLIQILNPLCYKPGLIGISITFLQSILEIPIIFNSYSNKCNKLEKKLNKKCGIIFKIIIYLGISIGYGFIYNLFNKCPIIIVNAILSAFSFISYIATLAVYNIIYNHDTDNVINKRRNILIPEI